MRFGVLLLFLLPLVTASAASAQTNPYQWAGPSNVTYTGDASFVILSTQCRADHGPGARMCTSTEIMDSDTLNPNGIPATGCWVRPEIRGLAISGTNPLAIDDSGVLAAATSLTCDRWSIGTSAANGLVLGTDGRFSGGACNVSRPVACCKPIAVGEPQAFMMLPTGVGVLAMLSILKGGE